MKLLLTSNGLSNKSIASAMFELVGKPASETKVAFIPTAMNVEEGDKDWFIDDLIRLKDQNVESVDIVDISALPKEIWLPRIEAVDVLFFCGGNSPHLMRWIIESGFQELVPKLLETKVWVGISAGAMVTSPTLALSSKDKQLYYEAEFGFKSEHALGLVDFYIRPHFNSPHFPQVTEERISEIAKEVLETIYALDDMSAVKVVDGKAEVVSEGEYLVFNQK